MSREDGTVSWVGLISLDDETCCGVLGPEIIG